MRKSRVKDDGKEDCALSYLDLHIYTLLKGC